MDDEKQLWDWVARQMKIDDVPDPVKDEVEESGYVADVLDSAIEVSRDDVLDLEAAPIGHGRRRGRPSHR